MNAAPLEGGVRVQGLGRVYDDHYALVGLDAHFPPRTVTALLGPNGAGKSTLMGILSTLSRASEGTASLGASTLEDGGKVRARIGYVGHATMVYGVLGARENLHFFGKLYGVTDLKDKVDHWVERVGLARDADRPVSGFSRGMAQRLTLARALLPEPTLLLLDEPFTGLDQSGVELGVELFGERRDAGAVVVLASHDLKTTARLADRALILRRGRKVYEGAIEGDLADLYHRQIAERAA